MTHRQYNRLKEKFPKLWIENRDNFRNFFHNDGTMNALGHEKYDELKRLHRLRITKPRHKSPVQAKLLMQLRQEHVDLWKMYPEEFLEFFTDAGTLNGHGLRAKELLLLKNM